MRGKNKVVIWTRGLSRKTALICLLALPICAQEPTAATSTTNTAAGNSQGIATLAAGQPSGAWSTQESDDQQFAKPPHRALTGYDLAGSSVKDVLIDQKEIWTSPFRINKHTVLPWILVGGTAALLLAVDHPVSRDIPFSGTANNVGTSISRFGQWYTVLPAGAALFGAGWLSHDPKLTETGISSLEAVADADIVAGVFKVAARRQRPRDGDGGGHFEKGGSSFPSGHSTQAWALASVIADEYGDHKWVPVVAYTYATSISVARIMAQEHFTSDVFVGGAIGFFVGRYVVRTHRLANEFGRRANAASWLPNVQPEFTGPVKMANLSWAF